MAWKGRAAGARSRDLPVDRVDFALGHYRRAVADGVDDPSRDGFEPIVTIVNEVRRHALRPRSFRLQNRRRPQRRAETVGSSLFCACPPLAREARFDISEVYVEVAAGADPDQPRRADHEGFGVAPGMCRAQGNGVHLRLCAVRAASAAARAFAARSFRDITRSAVSRPSVLDSAAALTLFLLRGTLAPVCIARFCGGPCWVSRPRIATLRVSLRVTNFKRTH